MNLNLNYYLFGIVGYVLFLFMNVKQLMQNTNKNVLYAIGSLIMVCGFFIGIIELFYDNNGKKLLKSTEINIITDLPTDKIGLRHMFIFTFHFLNCYFPMNEGRLTLDMFALLGHPILMFNVENKLGNVSLLLFYLLSTIKSSKIKTNNFVPVIGNLSLFLFFVFASIRSFTPLRM